MKKSNNWTDDILAISGVVVPMMLILLSVFTPNTLANEEQKDTLLTAGLTALVTGGFRGIGKKTEIRQEVQQQEMNLSPSADFVTLSASERRYQADPQSYISQVSPEDEQYLANREPIASSQYRVVSPDDDD